MYWEQFWPMLRRGIIIFPHPNPPNSHVAYMGIPIWWFAVPVLVPAIGITVFVMSSKRDKENAG